jgi:tRNA-splicing ligase RtcB
MAQLAPPEPVVPLVQEGPVRWRIERHGAMRVPGIVFASKTLLPDVLSDQSLRQVANVAALPGIVEASYAMPDVHWGYGFPIGGVAATDVEREGVVSPGGVGFDISCGVRLLASDLDWMDVAPSFPALMDELDERIPRGLGGRGVWHLRDHAELREVLIGGSRYAVKQGFGVARDLERCEDAGAIEGRGPGTGERARARTRFPAGGKSGIGESLPRSAGRGGGLRPAHRTSVRSARRTGLRDDPLRFPRARSSDLLRPRPTMVAAMPRFGIEVPDRQLACAPIASPEARGYLAAMAAAANYGRANRHLLAEAARDAFAAATGHRDLDLVYDVSHNLAKLEEHVVDRERRLLCVHRKGATRALPPGDPELPPDLQASGQPVLIPGSMGTASYVLTGVRGSVAFHSTCHGAGRTMSRHAAKRRIRGATLRAELEASGISVRARSIRELPEEAPFAYKDIDDVVTTCEQAGLCSRVVRLRPLGVIKG